MWKEYIRWVLLYCPAESDFLDGSWPCVERLCQVRRPAFIVIDPYLSQKFRRSNQMLNALLMPHAGIDKWSNQNKYQPTTASS